MAIERSFDVVADTRNGSLVLVTLAESPGGTNPTRSQEPIVELPSNAVGELRFLGVDQAWSASASELWGLLDGSFMPIDEYGRIPGSQQMGTIEVPIPTRPIRFHGRLWPYTRNDDGTDRAIRVQGVVMQDDNLAEFRVSQKPQDPVIAFARRVFGGFLGGGEA